MSIPRTATIVAGVAALGAWFAAPPQAAAQCTDYGVTYVRTAPVYVPTPVVYRTPIIVDRPVYPAGRYYRANRFYRYPRPVYYGQRRFRGYQRQYGSYGRRYCGYRGHDRGRAFGFSAGRGGVDFYYRGKNH